MLVIDPPYITREVWAQYAITAKLLLAPNGRILLSTVAENAEMMKELLDVEPQVSPRWGWVGAGEGWVGTAKESSVVVLDAACCLTPTQPLDDRET